MQKRVNLKHVALLLGLLLPTVWCGAISLGSMDGYSHISIKEGNVQGIPKGSSIQAYINGHYLTVVFTENLGQVVVKVTSETGGVLETYWANTPEGLQTYLQLTGNYVINFMLPNGDEYYGEFTVTD